MTITTWNRLQISEALGESNRDDWHSEYGEEKTPTHSELLQFYVDSGRAERFAIKYRNHKPNQQEMDPEETSWQEAGDYPVFPESSETESVRYPVEELSDDDPPMRQLNFLDELASLSD